MRTQTNPEDPAAKEALASYNDLVQTLTNITQDALIRKWMLSPQMWDGNGNPQIKVGYIG